MAGISHFPLVSHLGADAASHVMRYRNGHVVQSGRGLAFWFGRSTAVDEVPLDDQALPFLFHGRSSDVRRSSRGAS